MTVSFEAGNVRVEVDPGNGCRLTSLRIRGHELLRTDGYAPFGSGCVVMAPWAGRIRRGQARWNGRLLTLEPWLDGHAIHGSVHSIPWERIADSEWEVAVPGPWFGQARVRHELTLHDDRLDLRLEVHADGEPVPATVGWHPWFRRNVAGSRLHLDVPAGWMLERDPDGIASDRRVAVPPGPWDDAFGAITWPVTITWAGVVVLTLDSDAPIAVVYTEAEDAVCVEPQSGPPDEVNRAARVVHPGDPLVLTTTWRWADAPADDQS